MKPVKAHPRGKEHKLECLFSPFEKAKLHLCADNMYLIQ